MKRDEKYWPIPKVKSIGFFSDSLIYLEVLAYAINVDYFTKSDLAHILSNRVKGLVYTKEISITAINNLIKELYAFNWIEYYLTHNLKDLNLLYYKKTDNEIYSVSAKGKLLFEKFNKDKSFFFDRIISELYKLYTTPGWFVQRLWDINPTGQGQVIIPTPPKGWNPVRKPWNENSWDKELEDIVVDSYNLVRRILPSSFPISLDNWKDDVKQRWILVGKAKPRKDITPNKNNNEYTPRKRLALAMRECSVRGLFSNLNPKTGRNDFHGNINPLNPRSYAYWCSRLEEIGLINYTDYNINFPGRLIYPLSTFNPQNKNDDFVCIDEISNLDKNQLYIFRPSTESRFMNELFLSTLFEEYNKIYRRNKSLYISSQDLRDDVCRILKLSSYLFDDFLEHAVNMSVYGLSKYRISLETDIREDQQSRSQMQRKPVYFNKKIISLVAITYA